MSMSIPTAGPGVGLRFRNVDFRMTCTPGCTKGDVMVVSLGTVANDTFTTVIVPDAIGSGGDNIQDVDTPLACVALETVAAAGSGMFRFAGMVEAMTSGAVAVGFYAELVLDTTGKLSIATAGEKAMAIAVDLGADDEVSTFIFDGINGFAGGFTD